MNITVKKNTKDRFWSVMDGEELVCVTVYKKGAERVRELLESDRR